MHLFLILAHQVNNQTNENEGYFIDLTFIQFRLMRLPAFKGDPADPAYFGFTPSSAFMVSGTC